MSEAIITTQSRNVRIYAPGGTGINIARRYRENQTLEWNNLRGNEKFTFIDTSLANLGNVSASECFILPEVDGSGGDKKANAERLIAATPKILLDHPPADGMNIVVFGITGGSGSVSGPDILKALLAAGHTACAVIVNNNNSLKRTTNGIGTLMQMQEMAQELNRVVPISYKETDPAKTHAENDIVPQFVISLLSILGSGRNDHLDGSDVRNFFDYHKVTHHAAGLAMLNVYSKEEDLRSASTAGVISYLALMRDRNDPTPIVKSDYDKEGYLPEGPARLENSFFYTMSTTPVSEMFRSMNETIKRVQQQRTVVDEVVKLNSGVATRGPGGVVDF